MKEMNSACSDEMFLSGCDCAEPIWEETMPFVMDVAEIRKRLFLQVISAKRVPLGIPAVHWEDLAIVARIMIHSGDNEMQSAMVTEAVMEAMGMCTEELYAVALENATVIAPFSITNLKELMVAFSEELPETEEEMIQTWDAEGEDALYVVTCRQGIYGAASMFYPDFVTRAEAMCGGGFYVLPASIHEVMIVSDKVQIRCEDLKEMVSEINSSTLEEWERLSDSVYHYDPACKVLKRCC